MNVFEKWEEECTLKVQHFNMLSILLYISYIANFLSTEEIKLQFN